MNLNNLEITRIDVIGRDSEKTRKLNDYTAGALDAENRSFDTLERTIGHSHTLAFMKLVGDVFEIESVVGHYLADLHEVGHGFIGYDNGVAGGFVPHEMGWSVLPHCIEIFLYESFCRTDKAKIGNGWCSDCYGLAFFHRLLAGHGHEMLHSDLAETGTELQDSTIRDPYREPMYLFILRHNAKIRYLLDFTKALQRRDRGGYLRQQIRKAGKGARRTK